MILSWVPLGTIKTGCGTKQAGWHCCMRVVSSCTQSFLYSSHYAMKEKGGLLWERSAGQCLLLFLYHFFPFLNLSKNINVTKLCFILLLCITYQSLISQHHILMMQINNQGHKSCINECKCLCHCSENPFRLWSGLLPVHTHIVLSICLSGPATWSWEQWWPRSQTLVWRLWTSMTTDLLTPTPRKLETRSGRTSSRSSLQEPLG